MSSVESLRLFISDRLSAAAAEIFSVFQQTIVQYQEEVEAQRRLLDSGRKHSHKSPRADSSEQHVWLEQQLQVQGIESSLDQEDQEEPESAFIKEEQEEVDTSQEGEQLLFKEEVDTYLISYGEQSEPELSGELLNPQDFVAPETQPQKKKGKSRSSRQEKSKYNMRHHSKNVDNASITPQSSAPVQMVTADKPHCCSRCGRGFSQPWYLAFHMRSHTKEKPHSCVLCGKKFSWKSNLTVHMKTHTGDKPHSCLTCGKSFAWKSNLSVHMRTHTGERPYPCLTCGKCFSQPFSLSVHMKTHTGEKPHACTTCGKSFIHQSRLLFHMKTHTGEKPYSCVSCRKSFSTNGNFQRHLRTHRGEKPYSCLVCDKRFSKQSSVLHHMKTHTGEKLPKGGKR